MADHPQEGVIGIDDGFHAGKANWGRPLSHFMINTLNMVLIKFLGQSPA
jgi:hypothetical protein